jgi:hypothetical protein
MNLRNADLYRELSSASTEHRRERSIFKLRVEAVHSGLRPKRMNSYYSDLPQSDIAARGLLLKNLAILVYLWETGFSARTEVREARRAGLQSPCQDSLRS